MAIKENKTQGRIQQIKEIALQDLEAFIRLVAPHRVLGHMHKEVIQWWNREDRKSHQLVLLPRDHGKSAMVAYRVAWEITKNPAVRVLYISSTSNLAVKQLKFIKDILTSPIYRKYWPEMVNREESKREKWTETEISVDHPIRKKEAIRDSTVFTAGLTTNITGLHCDISVLDDVVVDDNAYTDEGRERVRNQASYLASIAGTDSQSWAVGTRYHPKDLYNDFMEQVVEIRNEVGEIVDSYNLWEIYEKKVEDVGDGTGDYLWPREQRADGKWFGFNQQILAQKKAQYSDKAKFNAQYYNNPNDYESASITSEMFQHYNKEKLVSERGKWYYGLNRLNVFAAVDFAWSLRKEADFTAIVIVGADSKSNYYILAIERFKTNKIGDYFDKILALHSKWGFNKINCEVTAAQEMIVKDLKENYIRKYGLALSVEEHRPTRAEGSKEERIESILQPKYHNRQIWHYKGGNCELLEEELILQNPAHDDMKDALASALSIAVPPSHSSSMSYSYDPRQFYNTRFGGIA